MTETTLLTILISGVTAALVSGLFTLWVARLNRKSEERKAQLDREAEERRHIREIGVTVGTTNFQKAHEKGQEIANRIGQQVVIPPLYIFIMEGIQLVEIATNPKLSIDEIHVLMKQHEKRKSDVRTTIDPTRKQ